MYRFSIGTTDVLTMKKEKVHKVLKKLCAAGLANIESRSCRF